MIPSRQRRSYVHIVRKIDGHKIERVDFGDDDDGLTPEEVLALRMAERCLPGELVAFDVFPVPRPWEEPVHPREG